MSDGPFKATAKDQKNQKTADVLEKFMNEWVKTPEGQAAWDKAMEQTEGEIVSLMLYGTSIRREKA